MGATTKGFFLFLFLFLLFFLCKRRVQHQLHQAISNSNYNQKNRNQTNKGGIQYKAKHTFLFISLSMSSSPTRWAPRFSKCLCKEKQARFRKVFANWSSSKIWKNRSHKCRTRFLFPNDNEGHSDNGKTKMCKGI